MNTKRRSSRILGAAFLVSLGPAAVHGQGLIEQTASYDQGVPLLISWGTQVDVGVMPVEREGIGRRRQAFLLLVANRTSRPFDVSSYNVAVTSGDQPAALVSAEILARETRRRSAWTKAGVALAGGLTAGMAADNAGRYSHSGQFYGTVSDGRSVSTFSGNVRVEGRDGAASDLAAKRELDRTNAALHHVDAIRNARLDSIQNSILMQTTVRPGEELFRTIVVEPVDRLQPGNPLSFKVFLAGETHELRLRYTSSGWVALPNPSAREAGATAGSRANALPTPRPENSGSLVSGGATAKSLPATPQPRDSTHAQEAHSAQNALPALAMQTAQTSPTSGIEIQIRPHLEKFRVQRKRAADRSRTISNVTFDVQWTVSTGVSRLPRRVIGDLVFSDDSGHRVRIPWALPSEGDRLPGWQFADLDTGFMLESELAVQNWIRSLPDINRAVRYEINRIEY